MNKKIIYDLGANNGDDIPYYLLKADLVVAVEANPVLCNLMRGRFKEDIARGRLVIENCILTAEASSEQVAFYIHKTNHVLSQLPKPSKLEHFKEVFLKSKNVIDLIKGYGAPFYVKVDIEHYDQEILYEIFSNNIIPPYISSESHNIKVFSTLVALGGYNAFKLVDGLAVSRRYKDCEITTSIGLIKYAFPHHSAGPFGGDISGPWMTANNFFSLLAYVGLGWKDIHATNIEVADPQYAPKPKFNIKIDF